MKQIDNSNYDEVIKNNQVVIVDFYADWCGPCQMYGPVFEAVSKEEKDLVMVKCNIDEGKRVAAKYGVRSIPTTIAFQQGEPMNVHTGMMNEQDLKDFIFSVK